MDLTVGDNVLVTKNTSYDKYHGLGAIIEIQGKEALVNCASGNCGSHPFSSWFKIQSLYCAPKPAKKD